MAAEPEAAGSISLRRHGSDMLLASNIHTLAKRGPACFEGMGSHQSIAFIEGPLRVQ
jgi:hypothetical protein